MGWLKVNRIYTKYTMPIEMEETDIRILMLRLKDLERQKKAEAREAERQKKAEERKKQQQNDAEERKRQKIKDSINKQMRELGIDISLK